MQIQRFRLKGWFGLGWLGLFWAAVACGPDSREQPAGPGAPDPVPKRPSVEAEPEPYRLRAQPISPTLAHLFGEGRIVVVPDVVLEGPAGVTDAGAYLFSAVDRYGGLHHFLRGGAWRPGPGPTLPAPLPRGQWDAAWNERTESVEVLVTGSWNGHSEVQLLRWRPEAWYRAGPSRAPRVRTDACRLFRGATECWMFVGGRSEQGEHNEGWQLTADGWTRWGAPSQVLPGPDLGGAVALLDGPVDTGIGLLTRDGSLWRWQAGQWIFEDGINIERLCLAHYVPDRNRWLFVWKGEGPGRDRIFLRPPATVSPGSAGDGTEGSPPGPALLAATSLVHINDQETGLWLDWGTVSPGEEGAATTEGLRAWPVERFEQGFGGPGQPALLISGEYGEAAFTHDHIRQMELPPGLEDLHAPTAAYVPRLESVVVGSDAGVGLEAGPRRLAPADVGVRTGGGESMTINVVQTHPRFWMFRGEQVEWLECAQPIHPEIGFRLNSRWNEQRRRLTWRRPSPGRLQYAYHQWTEDNHQWRRSGVLDLSAAVGGGEPVAGERWYLTDPVVFGDPAQVLIAGWHGPRLEAGFLARVDALQPQRWRITALPMEWGGQWCLRVADHEPALYLIPLGPEAADEVGGEAGDRPDTVPGRHVWRWDGRQWQDEGAASVPPGGFGRRGIAYHPVLEGLVILTAEGFNRFERPGWERLGARGAPGSSPAELFVHPETGATLSRHRTGEEVHLRRWDGRRWGRVRVAEGAGEEAMEVLASEDLVPAASGQDGFVAIDVERLAQIRLNAPRDRSEDPHLAAWRIRFEAPGAREEVPGVPGGMLARDEAGWGGPAPVEERPTTVSATASAAKLAPALPVIEAPERSHKLDLVEPESPPATRPDGPGTPEAPPPLDIHPADAPASDVPVLEPRARRKKELR